MIESAIIIGITIFVFGFWCLLPKDDDGDDGPH